MPWLLIAVGAALLSFIRPQSSGGPSTNGTSPQSAANSNQGTLSQPAAGGLFVPLEIYTNRPTGKIVGGITTPKPEGPSAGDQALATAKQVVSYVKTAVNAAIETAKAAGVAISQTVTSAVPIVGAVIGIGTASASLAQGSTTEGQSEATSLVGAVPGVGLVGLAITIPKIFEGISAATHDRHAIKNARFAYTKAVSDLGVWIPKAIAVSDRLDEWHDLGRLTPANQIAFATAVNNAAVDLINAGPQTVSVALDHITNGESLNGIKLYPGRDTTETYKIWGKASRDAVILQMVTADFLSRKGKPYKVGQFMDPTRFLGMIANDAGYPGSWTNPERAGIIPGAQQQTFSGTFGSGMSVVTDVPLAPSLAILNNKLVPPRWTETLMQYFETADPIRWHTSPLYARMVASRALETLDAEAPIAHVDAINPATVQTEIGLTRTAAGTRSAEDLAQQEQSYLAIYQQQFTSGGN